MSISYQWFDRGCQQYPRPRHVSTTPAEIQSALGGAEHKNLEDGPWTMLLKSYVHRVFIRHSSSCRNCSVRAHSRPSSAHDLQNLFLGAVARAVGCESNAALEWLKWSGCWICRAWLFRVLNMNQNYCRDQTYSGSGKMFSGINF